MKMKKRRPSDVAGPQNEEDEEPIGPAKKPVGIRSKDPRDRG